MCVRPFLGFRVSLPSLIRRPARPHGLPRGPQPGGGLRCLGRPSPPGPRSRHPGHRRAKSPPLADAVQGGERGTGHRAAPQPRGGAGPAAGGGRPRNRAGPFIAGPVSRGGPRPRPRLGRAARGGAAGLRGRVRGGRGGEEARRPSRERLCLRVLPAAPATPGAALPVRAARSPVSHGSGWPPRAPAARETEARAGAGRGLLGPAGVSAGPGLEERVLVRVGAGVVGAESRDSPGPLCANGSLLPCNCPGTTDAPPAPSTRRAFEGQGSEELQRDSGGAGPVSGRPGPAGAVQEPRAPARTPGKPCASPTRKRFFLVYPKYSSSFTQTQTC